MIPTLTRREHRWKSAPTDLRYDLLRICCHDWITYYNIKWITAYIPATFWCVMHNTGPNINQLTSSCFQMSPHMLSSAKLKLKQTKTTKSIKCRHIRWRRISSPSKNKRVQFRQGSKKANTRTHGVAAHAILHGMRTGPRSHQINYGIPTYSPIDCWCNSVLARLQPVAPIGK